MQLPRSWWAFGMVSLSVVLLGASYFFPWYEYHETTGDTTDFARDRNLTVEREDQFYRPFHASGDLSDEDRDRGDPLVQVLGYLWAATLAASILSLLLEVVLGHREGIRWPQVLVALVVLVGALAALAWTWFYLPLAVEHEGVQATFTQTRVEDVYVKTTVGWGWLLAGLNLFSIIAFAAFKFAMGAFDASAVEEYTTTRAN